jgi:hypothetical protein
VKISGDGANMTRQTSFVVMSFSVVDSDDIMSSKVYYIIEFPKFIQLTTPVIIGQ